MNILERFEEVVIDNDSRIAEADRDFCINREDRYISELESLNMAIDFLKSTFESNKLILNCNGNDKLIESLFKDNAKKIEGEISALKYGFINDVQSYFIDKYSLKTYTLSPHDVPMEKATYKHLLDHIIKQLKGMSLEESGSECVKACFRGCFENWRGEMPKIQGDRAILKNMVSFSGICEDRIEESGRIWSLVKAISFYEQQSLEALGYVKDSFPFGWDKHLRLGDEVAFSDLSVKIKSFKLYKNGRVDLRFHSKEMAQEFWKVLELDKIELRQ